MFKQVAISCLFRSPMIIIIISRIINPFELNYFDHIYIYIKQVRDIRFISHFS